ncbi:FxSxx-COOH system tetratricopeptide repeat protein [Actinoplanes sp. Pm04-4]|uniref:FxSxx-COOH system tetratricopeptide repeat protein n=1 Tax=Paractinoplanes pyxinae TaxID=2997416 RepID=A0ABT4BFL0_9ACTN|nr:FxSxx-COOH system tetratricopeptide repeat protein [Actinoplanes pyxinae]MCY1144345.1 FxSxx-COOH system tetratricopeptide repeat protein [Actinoplanes pyxinae]
MAALVDDVPIINNLPDRRLLINLVRRDVRTFPDVPEREQARSHVIEIVLACISTRGGLRALKEALVVMAPEAPGTRIASSLVESASLSSLLLQGENQRAHELLHQAEAEAADPAWWRAIVVQTVPGLNHPPADLVKAFETAAGRGSGSHDAAAALTFIRRVAADLENPVGVALRTWADEVGHRLELPDGTPADPAPEEPHRDPGEPSASPPLPAPTSSLSPHGAPDGQVDGNGDENGDMSQHETRTELRNRDVAPTPGGDAEAAPATHGDQGDTSAGIGDDMAPVADRKLKEEKLPQVWGDVPQRNPDFTGREDFLEILHNELSERRQTAVLPQAIHGMGGVGKSQIAIEYVHRHSQEFDLVWWIPAEETGQILTSLTKLAQRLRLDVTPEANAAVPAVQEALSTGATGYRDWLLVFDNAEDPTEARKYFPTGGAGRILVTSRNPDWERGTRALEVDVFTREESITLLQNRNSDLSDRDADSLAKALGDLPLAIEAASAWRATTGMDTSEYLRLLNDKRLDLLDVEPPPDYRLTVRAAWKLSLEKLAVDNLAALQLLQVCSFFAPEPIPRSLFTGSNADITPELDAMLRDTYSIGRAIRDILKLALAKYDHQNNTMQIHRLIRLVLTDSMDAEQQTRMRHGAHMLLVNADPNDPGRRDQWERYGALRAHVEASDAVASDNPRVHDLVFSVVQYLYYFGDHQGSQSLAEQAFRHRTLDRGPTDGHTLRLAKWLGWMYFVNGKYAAARELNRKTLEHYRDVFGDEDEGTLDAMKVVGVDLRASGDFKAGLDLDQRAVAAARRAFGPDDPITLNGTNNLGVNLRLLGLFQQAEKLDADNYERLQKVLGSNSDASMLALYNLLIDRRELGDYVAARNEHEAAYVRSVETFGRDAPATLRMARALAVARRKAGDHPGALRMSKDTFDRYQRRYGKDYPDTIATAQNLAVDLRHGRDLPEARKLGEDTLERYLRLFGPKHVYSLSARTNLAVVLRLDGDFDTALGHDRESLAVLTETLGPDHPVTLTCATNFGSDLFALGEISAAYEKDIDTLASSERALGTDHPSTLACSVNLALDLRALGREAEADKILSDTLARLRKALGERHPATLNALNNYRADCDVDPMPL